MEDSFFLIINCYTITKHIFFLNIPEPSLSIWSQLLWMRWGLEPIASSSTLSSWSLERRMPPTTTPGATTPLVSLLSLMFNHWKQMKITQQFHKIEISNQAHKIHVKQNLLSDNYNLYWIREWNRTQNMRHYGKKYRIYFNLWLFGGVF